MWCEHSLTEKTKKGSFCIYKYNLEMESNTRRRKVPTMVLKIDTEGKDVQDKNGFLTL